MTIGGKLGAALEWIISMTAHRRMNRYVDTKDEVIAKLTKEIAKLGKFLLVIFHRVG